MAGVINGIHKRCGKARCWAMYRLRGLWQEQGHLIESCQSIPFRQSEVSCQVQEASMSCRNS